MPIPDYETLMLPMLRGVVSFIGRHEIQKFAGSLIGMGAKKGVFLTTASYSRHAREYAAGLPQRIILIDGDQLTTLMLEHNVGSRVRRVVELKRIDEDFFIEGE